MSFSVGQDRPQFEIICVRARFRRRVFWSGIGPI